MTTEQAEAAKQAFEVLARLSLGQLDTIVDLITADVVIPSAELGDSATSQQITAVGHYLNQARGVLGYAPGAGLSIVSPRVHISGRRSWELYKVFAQALLQHRAPSPPLAARGPLYDGLVVRNTDDPAPIARIAAPGTNADIEIGERRR